MQSKSAGCEAAGRVPCLWVNEGRFSTFKRAWSILCMLGSRGWHFWMAVVLGEIMKTRVVSTPRYRDCCGSAIHAIIVESKPEVGEDPVWWHRAVRPRNERAIESWSGPSASSHQGNDSHLAFTTAPPTIRDATVTHSPGPSNTSTNGSILTFVRVLITCYFPVHTHLRFHVLEESGDIPRRNQYFWTKW